MKKKILFVINTLGGAGAEMALLELLEKLEKENEKTKDVQYEISLYVLMGQGELVKKLPKEVLLKNKSYQPLSVLQKIFNPRLRMRLAIRPPPVPPPGTMFEFFLS